MTKNKLDVTQREKAGAKTFSKYEYQYHWALYKAISLTKDRAEYIVLVEMHEDVVMGDSLDGTKVRFEFNQVKTDSKPYTSKSLVKRVKNAKGESKPSVLAKLLSYSTRFDVSHDVIKSFNLIASNGFSLSLKESNKNYGSIGIEDIQDADVKILSDAIKKELEIDSLPSNLHFITSSYLPEQGFQNYLIGMIATVMNDVFGTSHGANSVYLALLDELHRKGQEVLDFKNWENLVDCKGVTSITVERVIKEFVDKFSESDFRIALEDYLVDIKAKAQTKISIRKNVLSYISERSDSSFPLIRLYQLSTLRYESNIQNI